MAVYLNNRVGINDINTALLLINRLQNNIIEYNLIITRINKGDKTYGNMRTLWGILQSKSLEFRR